MARSAADFLKKKAIDRQKIIDRRYASAESDFGRIVAMIVRKYRPERVYQWGSLLRKERFTEISDIDIAVEGLADSSLFFALLSDVEDMTDLPVDVVEIEHLDLLHVESIKRKGRLIYERQN